MAFNIPTSQQQVIDRASTDVQIALPQSNPFFKNSFIGALIYSFSGRIYDFYTQLNILLLQLFVDTATGLFLERWGTYKGIVRNPATQSNGLITATGIAGSVIALNTQFTDTNGNIFKSTAAKTISAVSVSITLTRSGSTVTAITSAAHNFSSDQTLVISGADQTEYNGSQIITVISLTSFTYQITTTPTTPATGTILTAANMASITVQSVGYGETQNLTNGAKLSLGSPISGVNTTASVQYSQVSGGTDLESDDNLRIRIIDIYQNPISHFNVNDIDAKAKQLSGVTRTWIYSSGDLYGNSIAITSINRNGNVATVITSSAHGLENCMVVAVSGASQTDYNITARVLVIDSVTFCYVVANAPVTPATGTVTAQASIPLGQVVVFFTRDNDASIIPSASEVTDLTSQLSTIKPANTADSDFLIKSPAAVSVPFVFTSLTPNTSTMQDAITANLTALFQESTQVGQNLQSFAYNSAIFQTVDPITGDIVSNFSLSAPSGNVTINAGELAVLGGITYP